MMLGRCGGRHAMRVCLSLLLLLVWLTIANTGNVHSLPVLEFPRSSGLWKKETTYNETMKVCKPAAPGEKCEGNCKSYTPPLGACYSPPELWPGDPQWGSSDTLDSCNETHLDRSFFASTNGTCIARTDGFSLPLHTCVGPFGKPRPWGSFSCGGGPDEASARAKTEDEAEPAPTPGTRAQSAVAWSPVACPGDGEHLRGDVAVYAGTAGGVVAAVAAARMHPGARVIVVNPTGHLGGMVSGGLGSTDGHPSGGIAQEFFDRVGGMTFSPSMAEAVFDGLAANASLVVTHHCHGTKVQKDSVNGRVLSLTTASGGTVAATAWIDSSYEGELMALSRVSFTFGRESREQYGESIAGRLPAPPVWKCGCNWNLGPVNGIGADGAPLPMVQSGSQGAHEPVGAADDRVQAYNFRLCVTNVPSIRFAFPPPTSYDASQWELLRRAFKANPKLDLTHFFKPTALPGAPGKYDLNNGGGLSTDFVGASDNWPNGSYAQRAKIFEAHREYTLGLLHFLHTDASVGSRLKEDIAKWGLCADEFVDDPIHWPHQLYVREGRRMLSSFVFTLHDRVNDTHKTDSIAVGDYNVDAHMAQRVLLPNGTVTNEGCLSGWHTFASVHLGSFDIPFRVMLPPHHQATNLLVSAAVSASHVGSGPLRLEPQYMNLGHAAGVAASMLVANRSKIAAVQDIDISELQQRLVQQGVVIHAKPNDRGTRCILRRCVPTGTENPAHVACTNCSFAQLATNEWLGSSGAWKLLPTPKPGKAVAMKVTHLKKSLANSADLPSAMVKLIRPGVECSLAVDGAEIEDQLFACVLDTSK